MSLLIGVLKNNWSLVALMLSIVTGFSFWKGEHELLIHTRTVLAAKSAALNEAKALAKKQDAAATKLNNQQKAQTDVIQSQLTSALAAHAITGAALTASVLKYENDRNSGQMCQRSGAAPSDTGHHGTNKSASGDQSIAATIAVIPAACQTVIDQLSACQTWARTVRCSVP